MIVVSFVIAATVVATVSRDMSATESFNPTNWSTYNLDANNGMFYNGNPCIMKNNPSTWINLRNPDGTLYTASRRPITLVVDAWDSSYLTTYVMQYILESMGYQVQVVTHIVYDFGVEFIGNYVDMNLEIWPVDFSNFFNLTQVEHKAISFGSIGYQGQAGLYTQSSVVNQHFNSAIDFWKFQKTEEALKLFPQVGSGPVVSPPECDDMPGKCTNGTYIPKQCMGPTANCFEIWAFDPSYSPGWIQRILDGLEIPAVVKFLGFSAEDYYRTAFAENRTIIFYSWIPTVFVATQDVTRILYPSYKASEWKKFYDDESNKLTSDTPSTILEKVASVRFVNDFQELQSYLNYFQITVDDINSMLSDYKMNNLTYSQASCNWVQKSQNIWSKWIPEVPVSVEYCPSGFGRYFVETAYVCIPCAEHTYNVNSTNTGPCQKCPDTFTCLGGSDINVNRGLWMPSNQSETLTYYKCPVVETCCGESSCPPDTCNDGFSGILCTECSDPSKFLWGSTCKECSTNVGVSFYLMVLGGLLCAFLLLLLPYEEAPTVEILFFYFQVTRYVFQSQADGVLQIPGLSTFLDLASLNADGIAHNCTLKIRGIAKMIFRFFLPSIIIFDITLIYFVTRLVQTYVPGANEQISKLMPYYMKGQPISLICFRAIIVAMTFVVMPFVDSSLNLLNCVNIQGKYVLQFVPQVECYKSAHIGPAALALIVLFLMLVVLPILLSVLLHKLYTRKLISYEHDLSPIQSLFQCIYVIFKPEYFYMLPIAILEKGLISVMFTLMNQYSEQIQMDTFIIVLSLICGTRIYVQPYKNSLEAYLNREVSLGILAMVALRLYTTQYGTSSYTIIEIAAIIFTPLLLHLIRWTSNNYVKHKDTISNLAVSMKKSRTVSQNSSLHKDGNDSDKQITRCLSVERVSVGIRNSRVNNSASTRGLGNTGAQRGAPEETRLLNSKLR